MRARFRDSMTWLHTWAGLVVGWVLFAVFLTGTLAYFQNEISAWMQPEIRQTASPAQSIAQAQQFLNKEGADSPGWTMVLPTHRFSPTTVYWRDLNAGGRGFRSAQLDDSGQQVALRETRGGVFLYRFHFDLHYIPVLYARWLVGICTMFMLVAIITGVIIHKKIFKDFFTLKFRKGSKSWLDGHTVASVLSLPFHLMITYTGLVTLMFMYLSWSISMGFNNRNEFLSGVSEQPAIPNSANLPQQMLPLDTLYNDAVTKMQSGNVSFVTVHHPGDANATAVFTESATDTLMSDYRTLTYSAVSGELQSDIPVTNAAEQTRRTMISLHAGRFADSPLRWLYFLSGVMGTVMIATGLILWSEKRKRFLASLQARGAGHKLVDILNVGFLLGLPVAVASYFLANRLLPLELADRADMEIHCFFIGWLVMLLYPLLRGTSRCWKEGTLITALMYLSLPIINLFVVERNLLNYDFSQDLTLMVVDVMLLLSGGIFLFIFKHLKHSGASDKPKPVTSKQSKSGV